MIAILDCQAHDADRVKNAFRDTGADAKVVIAVDAVERAAKIVLPDVSSYARAIAALRDRGLIGALLRAIDRGCPILGISRGLHMLLDVSYEAGQHTGLGIIHGKATRFDFGSHPAARHFTVPHTGWNEVQLTADCPLMAGVASGAYFYFDHAYHAEPLDDRTICATTNHGVDFTAVLRRDRVFGTQFLPERSDEPGRTVLANFARL